MGATVTLQNTADFCAPFINWANVNIGSPKEPFLSIANLAAQTLVGPPFAWAWNRSEASFLTQQGVQDYTVPISSFGWPEAISIQMVAAITSVTVTNNVAVYTAVNNFSSLLSNGPVPTTITGCTTSALNGTQTIQSANATSFTCNVATSNLTEVESGAQALAGPVMSLEYKTQMITEAVEQDRPSFTCLLQQQYVQLAIAKSHTGDFTQGQAGATFQVVVSNPGAVASLGTVTVTETVPSGFTLVSMAGTGWTVNGNVATRSDSLPAGQSYPAITVTVNVADNASSPQVNTVTASGGGMEGGGGAGGGGGNTGSVVAHDSVTVDSATPQLLNVTGRNCFFGDGTISVNITGGVPLQVGDTMVLTFDDLGPFGSTVSSITISDNYGSNWGAVTPLTQVNSDDGSGNPASHAFWLQTWVGVVTAPIADPTTLAITLHVTASPSGAAGGEVSVSFWRGLGALDTYNTSAYPYPASTNTPSITTTATRVLIVSLNAGVTGGTPPLPSGWHASANGGSDVGYLDQLYYGPSGNLVAPAGTYAPVFSNIDSVKGSQSTILAFHL